MTHIKCKFLTRKDLYREVVWTSPDGSSKVGVLVKWDTDRVRVRFDDIHDWLPQTEVKFLEGGYR